MATAAMAQPVWQKLLPGMEVGLDQASTTSGSASPELIFIRLNPEKFRFQILYQPPTRLTAQAWLEKSQALLVCNIGQYDEQYNYLGLLIKDGVAHSQLKANQSGIFLAETSAAGQPQARILDLRYSAFALEHNPYLQAAQSLMLLDRYGNIRVRRSNKTAHRSLLGQDTEGNILLIVSKGRHTLWELAAWLKDNVPGLREVMCMDGGSEAQLAINAGSLRFNSTGSPQLLPDIPWPSAKLPMALAVYPR